MTVEERKRGLRAAVQAKREAYRKEHGACTSNIEITLLWQVIDALVEESAEYSEVLAEFQQDVEANGVRTTGVEWPDLLLTYNRARRIQPFEERPAHPVNYPAVKLPLPEVEYRCLWEECMGSIDGPLWIPFSGRVGTLQNCAYEREVRKQDPKFRNVTIEARPAQTGPWPRPWDIRPADTQEYGFPLAPPGDPAHIEACHICGKPKGQPPERCPGHYEDVRPADKGCYAHRGAPVATCADCLAAEREGE